MSTRRDFLLQLSKITKPIAEPALKHQLYCKKTVELQNITSLKEVINLCICMNDIVIVCSNYGVFFVVVPHVLRTVIKFFLNYYFIIIILKMCILCYHPKFGKYCGKVLYYNPP